MSIQDDRIETSNLESIYFELNETQLPKDIKYILDYQNQRMYFINNGIDLYLTVYDKDLLKIKFNNSSSNMLMSTSEQLPQTTVYPALNIKGIKNYKTMTYQGIYQNIDLMFDEAQTQIQQTFVINPGGDFGNIQMDLTAADSVEVLSGGRLSISFRDKVFYLAKPEAIQVINGVETNIQVNYRVLDKRVTFSISSFDYSQALTLGATYDFSYIPNTVAGNVMQLDQAKNQYIVIEKSQVKDLNTVITYIKMLEWANALVKIFSNFMEEDEAYRMIATWMQDAYRVKSVTLKKLNASGQLVLVIKQLELGFEPREVPKPDPLVDEDGNIIPLPDEILNDAPDTMLPSVSDLAIDEQGNVYLAGDVTARQVDIEKSKPSWYPTNVVQYNPTGNGDGAILKLSSDGLVSYMTYFGGNNGTSIASIALYNQEIWMTGSTSATDLRVTDDSKLNIFWSDIFITHLNQDATQIIFSRYIGGEMIDYGRKILLYPIGNTYEVYVIANVENDVYIPERWKPEGELGHFPTTSNAMIKNIVEGTSAVSAIIKMTPTGEYLTKTLFDGGLGDTCILTAAIDKVGDLFIGGTTKGGIKMGRLNGNRAFSQVPYSHQDEYTGFICKIDPDVQTILTATYLGGSTEEYIDMPPYDYINPTPLVFLQKFIIYNMTLGADGYLYVTGKTGSVDFPYSDDCYQPYFSGATDAFICKFEPQYLNLYYSTFFGGSGTEVGKQIGVSDDGDVFVLGHTNSSGFENLTEKVSIGGAVFELVLHMNQSSDVVPLEPNLKKALNTILERDGDEDITQTDLRHLPQAVDLSRANIISLEGLEFAKFIKQLNLSDNNFIDLTPISSLAYLQYLDISQTGVSDLTPLNSLPQLETCFAHNLIITADQTFVRVGNQVILYLPNMLGVWKNSISHTTVSNVSGNGVYDKQKQSITWQDLVVGNQVSFSIETGNGLSGNVTVTVSAIEIPIAVDGYRYSTHTNLFGLVSHSLMYGFTNCSEQEQAVRVKIYNVMTETVVFEENYVLAKDEKQTYIRGDIPTMYQVVFEVKEDDVYLYTVPRIQPAEAPLFMSFLVLTGFYNNLNMKKEEI